MRRSFSAPGLLLACVMFLFSLCASGLAQADESVDKLKRQLIEMQREMGDLMKRIDQLEKKKAESDRVTSVEQSVKSIQKSPSILNPSIGLAIDTAFLNRDETDGGFSFRGAELGLAAAVDPYARAYSFLTGTEDAFELEEAAVVTTSLPFSLTAGRFFGAFGRLAQFHQHELPFVNAPLSLSRMVGGEALGTGAQISFLFPTPFYLAFTGGVFNELGHVHAHHDGNGHDDNGHDDDDNGHDDDDNGHDDDDNGHDDDDNGHDDDDNGHDDDDNGHDEEGSRYASHLTYVSRLHTFLELSETFNLELGSSLAYTPRVDLEEGGKDSRSLLGVDVTLRHRPLVADFYEGFTVAGEVFNNSQVFDDVGRKKARGGYAYAQMEFNSGDMGRWHLGLLWDSAPDLENPSAETTSLSPYLTWWPSEFNRIRLQYTHGDDEVGEVSWHEGRQVYLQWTTVLGSHSHGFRERR